MAYWVLPAFLASLGAGPAQLGLIEGVAESVASFAKLFSGYLTDHIDRRKPVVVAGYSVANAVKPLLALVTAWPQILLIRFTDRLAKGVRGAPRDVMVAESVPKNRLGSAYGLIQSMDSAGAIAGPLVALASARALRNSQRVLGRGGSGSVVRAGCAARHSRKKPGCVAADSREAAVTRSRQVQACDIDFGERISSARELLSCSGRRDAFFSRQLERYVPGDAGAERWHRRGARAAAGSGLQHHLHARIVACRMVQRPRLAAARSVRRAT